jgi:hypothetical protein
MILWFIAAFVVLLTLGILYLGIPSLATKSEGNDGPWDLSKGPAIPTENTDQFANSLNSSLRVFYYIDTLPRTNAALLDGSTPSYNTQTNTFDICDKSTGNTCAHPGFVKLLNISDSFYIELLQAPDASRPGLPKTQFVIQTQSIQKVSNVNTLKTYLETFTLPEFPIQKWVMLTVVRNGNRINIFYNNRLIFSKNTRYVPFILPGGGNFSVPQIRGTAKYLKTKDSITSQSEVNTDYSQIADTRGEPVEKLFEKMNITLCPSGTCFSGPQIRPANPLIEWSSDVM